MNLTGGGAPLGVLLQLLVALLGSIVALLGPLVALFDVVQVELQRRCVVPVGKRLPDLVFQLLVLLVSVLQLSACLVPVSPRLLQVRECLVPRRLAACHRDLSAAEYCPLPWCSHLAVALLRMCCFLPCGWQVQTWQRRWSLGTESGAARQLRPSISINKRTTVDSLFQAVRNKLGSSKKDARQ